MHSVRPFFEEATPVETRIMRICVAANLLVVMFCAGYLVRQFAASTIAGPHLLAAVLLGYFVADLASGAVHWGIDTWFDETMLGRAVAITREHHTHPQHVFGYGFLEHASLGSGPSAVFLGLAALVTALCPVSATTYGLMVILLETSLCLFFGMTFHNLAHERALSPLLRLAQRMHLICPPEHHLVHHRNQLVHYCVVNGWANYVCDTFRVWRGLEWAVQALTGAVPRRDDLAWQQSYKKTGILANPKK
jgi:hypothetical protein